MNKTVDNLKEIVRYGTFLTVRIPNKVLNEETDPLGKFDSTRQALKELQETEWLNVIVSDYGEETKIQITHNRK